MKPGLTRADFEAAAKFLRCDVPSIQAVAEVEAPGSGFLDDGRPKVLFEAHKFHKATGGRYTASHPNLSSVAWRRKLYAKTGEGEHLRLEKASALDRTAALRSASWGRFQILGSNHVAAGHPTLQGFVNAMYASEAAQLLAFCHFVKSEGIDDELRAQNWAGFARKYNGPAYAANHYDTKLAAAYARFKKD